MFVIMRDNVVVYCFLSEGVTSHAMDSDSQNDNDSLYLRPGSPSGGGYSLQQIESNGERSMTSGGELSHSKLHTTSFSSFVGTASPHGSPHSERTSSPTTGKQQPISTTSNLSPSIKKPRYIESRELLFEVHGVEFGGWISELVEMLESRLMSQITMKEVQQFLTRNPTSKLSRAVSLMGTLFSMTNDASFLSLNTLGFGIHFTGRENAFSTSHPSCHPCDL
jgi:hypothetical protein